MELTIEIHNVKNIRNLTISLTTEPGVYAITGQNGAGKSTLLSCATFTFNHIKELKNYIGSPYPNSCVLYNYNRTQCRLYEQDGNWKIQKDFWNKCKGLFGKSLRGFLEGSISFGNRFKNIGFVDFPAEDQLSQYQRKDAPDFVKVGMGKILHDNEHYYDNLRVSKAVTIGNDNKRDVYFYMHNGREIDQFHMSTGESFLASVLGALEKKNKKQKREKSPCMVFIDEIEFGLHPSAIKRLVDYFKDIAIEYQYAIYFSTHSLTIINEIADGNIYYLQKHEDTIGPSNIKVITPCAPAYATNILYQLHGFDDIILVEDEKARNLINYILKKENIIQNRLVYCIHAGGWEEVIHRAYEWKEKNAFGNNPKILAILDRDCQHQLLACIAAHPELNAIPYSFLPINSLEKYTFGKLYPAIDRVFEAAINSTIFVNYDIASVVRPYSPGPSLAKNDRNGKNLYKIIKKQLCREHKEEIDLIKFITDYVSPTAEYTDLKNFLIREL